MIKFMLSYCILLCPFLLIAQEEYIYISDAGNFQNPPWQILKYKADGSEGEVFTKTQLGWPQDIVFLEHKNEVLISNLTTDRITKYNAATGEYLGIFAAGINGPTRMTIGDDSLLYVLQWKEKGKVLRYDLDGNKKSDYTNTGVATSIGMAWDSRDNFYVSSYSEKVVYKFNADGISQGVFIESGLAGPTNIWFDEEDILYVIDYNGGSVKRFDQDGEFIDVFINGTAQGEGVAFFENGKIAIGIGSASSVKLYDEQGVFEQDIVPAGNLGLKTPNAVVLREIVPSSITPTIVSGQLVNPTVGRSFNLNWEVQENGIDSIEIFNETGKLVYKVAKNQSELWNAKQVPAGIYFVYGKEEKFQIMVQKIIVK